MDQTSFPHLIAGMPSILPDTWEFAPTLQEAVVSRLHTISFFVLGFMVSTFVVQGLWNYLARDWSVLPRMSIGKAFCLVLLCAMLLAIVLTMISGARELMTPGAWQKDGWTYKLSEPEE